MPVWKKGDLNPSQEDAINEPGSVFLIACPGSGKTRTLTYKLATLLSSMDSEKQWIVAITYTHRAADEIHERILALGVDTARLWIGTIHSFCLEWILKPYAIYHKALRHGFRIINSHTSEELLTELCKPYKNSKVTFWDCGHYYTSTDLMLSCQTSHKRPLVSAILEQYTATLGERRQIDFELILRYAYELIAANPSISVLLGSLFPSILVDEYQDTKEIQYAIIASILRAGKGKTTTFIVGDPNQAIYGSLGGCAIAIEEFRTMAGIEIKELDLSWNYRSSTRIVDYFSRFGVSQSEVVAKAKHKDDAGIISFDDSTVRTALEDQLVCLIRHSIENLGVLPQEVCVLAPQWMHLASMTRKLVTSLPEYRFDGPGMVPFSRDIDNFWYKLSRIVLTEASPRMYVRRLRWAGETLAVLDEAGVNMAGLSNKALLRHCNSIAVTTSDGLAYLAEFFETLFARLGVDFTGVPVLHEHHKTFFESAQARISRLQAEGATFIGDVATFKKVFENRTGITVSTIHGVKGAEYDTVIAYALLEGMVPHFSDSDGEDSARRLLYVISSRARKHLHLISERGRMNPKKQEYAPTTILSECCFSYDELA